MLLYIHLPRSLGTLKFWPNFKVTCEILFTQVFKVKESNAGHSARFGAHLNWGNLQ
jgi:hypothetical protein